MAAGDWTIRRRLSRSFFTSSFAKNKGPMNHQIFSEQVSNRVPIILRPAASPGQVRSSEQHAYDQAFLDKHMQKVKQYYDNRIAELERELARSQRTVSDLQERLQSQMPSMSLGPRQSSPSRFLNGLAARQQQQLESSNNDRLQSQRGFFASVLEEVRNSRSRSDAGDHFSSRVDGRH